MTGWIKIDRDDYLKPRPEKIGDVISEGSPSPLDLPTGILVKRDGRPTLEFCYTTDDEDTFEEIRDNVVFKLGSESLRLKSLELPAEALISSPEQDQVDPILSACSLLEPLQARGWFKFLNHFGAPLRTKSNEGLIRTVLEDHRDEVLERLQSTPTEAQAQMAG